MNDHLKSTWTTLLREQRIQEISTSTTVFSPDMIIQTNSPPSPDESTARYLASDNTVNETTFGWWHSENMQSSSMILNKSAIDPVILVGEDPFSSWNFAFSSFFRGALSGRTPLPPETMRKNDTDTRVLDFNHIRMFYNRYMAQYTSSNLRISAVSIPANVTNTSSLAKRADDIVTMPNITGSFTLDAGVSRLVQHRKPKPIMQVVLAVMFVCASLALLVFRYYELVLWNLCTVAGVMVLFAGSRVCQSRSQNDGDRIAQPIPSDHVSLISNEELTGHEMQDLSEVTPRIHEGEEEIEREELSAAVDGETDLLENAPSESERDWQDQYRNARFRLGWWKDGVYMGSRKTIGAAEGGSDNEFEDEGGRWRYGIDTVER